MKKRIIASLAILAVFGLAIVTYAYNQAPSSATAKASCCKKSDSCPMKSGNKDAGEHAGKSCPMKNHSGEHAKAEGHTSCDCCGDSCPLKKDGGAAATAASATETGKDCCDCCDCCRGKSETAA